MKELNVVANSGGMLKLKHNGNKIKQNIYNHSYTVYEDDKYVYILQWMENHSLLALDVYDNDGNNFEYFTSHNWDNYSTIVSQLKNWSENDDCIYSDDYVQLITIILEYIF